MINEIADDKNELTGLIFDIQGHSVHDGPGTRTTVFLAGCPLNCIWCCNPEGLFTKKITMYRETRCKHCGNCINACPYNAINIVSGNLIFDRKKCDVCTTKECVGACFNEAIIVSGKYYTIDQLMYKLKRDRPFWCSQGGVTFSGGEPLFQKKFILNVLKECKASYIHTCIETTSCVNTNFYMQVMEYVDWVFTDIKHIDSKKHKELTGVGNELILKNITEIALKPDWKGFIVPRIPIIPGYNDDEKNIRETARFVKKIDLELINILPFHRLGESKYKQLNQEYLFKDQLPPSDELMQNCKKIIEEEGLVCFIGYETPF